jgi:hypothetical protein
VAALERAEAAERLGIGRSNGWVRARTRDGSLPPVSRFRGPGRFAVTLKAGDKAVSRAPSRGAASPANDSIGRVSDIPPPIPQHTLTLSRFEPITQLVAAADNPVLPTVEPPPLGQRPLDKSQVSQRSGI